jgi:hypothetical protein
MRVAFGVPVRPDAHWEAYLSVKAIRDIASGSRQTQRSQTMHVLDRRFVTRAVRVLLPLWQLPTSKSNFGTATALFKAAGEFQRSASSRAGDHRLR